MENQVKSRSYTLREDSGAWLGQVVITSDGMFAAVTDYGNLSFSWSSTGEDDFRKFLCKLDLHYFARKMYAGLTYIAYGRKYEESCQRFAEKILPPLQRILKEELDNGVEW